MKHHVTPKKQRESAGAGSSVADASPSWGLAAFPRLGRFRHLWILLTHPHVLVGPSGFLLLIINDPHRIEIDRVPVTHQALQLSHLCSLLRSSSVWTGLPAPQASTPDPHGPFRITFLNLSFRTSTLGSLRRPLQRELNIYLPSPRSLFFLVYCFK